MAGEVLFFIILGLVLWYLITKLVNWVKRKEIEKYIEEKTNKIDKILRNFTTEYRINLIYEDNVAIIEVPKDKISSVIGKKGSVVNKIENITGLTIIVKEIDSDNVKESG